MVDFIEQTRSTLEVINSNKTVETSGHINKILDYTGTSLFFVLKHLVAARESIKEENQNDDTYYEADVDTITDLDFLLIEIAYAINEL